MIALSPLISDLAVILMTAGITSLLFKKLKQPVILGYMVAGFLVGPFFSLFPTVADTQSIHVWAEMGVIFMLFALGLEFSFRKLGQMGSTVAVIGLFEVLLIFSAFFLGGLFFNLTSIQSAFLAAALCLSSTSIVLKAIDEAQLKGKKFAQLVFGVLVLEDLLTIVILVLLTTLALTQKFEGTELLLTVGKLGFYIILWLITGAFLIPWGLKKVKKELSDESLLVLSLGLCFIMVVSATQAGFSAALGAFIMGSILSETDQKEKIQKIFLPVKNLFSAIFFVSVGMMISPQSLTENPVLILSLSFAVILAKITFVTMGALISGQSIRTAVPMSLSLAQIGEFSFVIGTMAVASKIFDQQLYSSIVAVSAVTTFITPYLLNSREKITDHVEALIPQRVQRSLNQYSQFSIIILAHPGWRSLAAHYLYRLLVNSILVIAIFVITFRVGSFFVWKSNWTTILAFVLSSPFLWGFLFYTSRDPKFVELINTQMSRNLRKFLFIFRMGLAFLLLTVVMSSLLPAQLIVFSFLGVFILISFLLSKYLGPIYIWLESRFIKQIENQASLANKLDRGALQDLAPWDAHLSNYQILPESTLVGKTLLDLSFREKFGITVALILRGEKMISAPRGEVIVMPFDNLMVIGTDQQLALFENYLNDQKEQTEHHEVSDYNLEQYLVTEKSNLIGKSIRDSGIRQLTDGLVVGVERRDKRILSPDSGMSLELGDLLWIAGDTQKIRKLP